MRNSFLALLITFSLLAATNQLCFAQANATNQPSVQQSQLTEIEKFKRKVGQIGIGGKITVIKLDNSEFYGSVSNIEADGFQINEVDSKRSVDFKYAELKKVRKDYGGKNYVVGKRVNPRRNLLIAAAILGGLFLFLGVALSKDR